jgi:RHS repeat-associated protein
MKLRLLAIMLFLANTLFSQNFHDTQGKLEISSAGQATYTLPIAMPPSLQNVGPIINLTYASGQMGGIAGQGWNISSISNISRMATRINIEGYVDGVDFDDNDKLAFDGQRLILKSGVYWTDGSIYETEVQSNTKIELKGTGTGMYFIVTAPDGSRSWYGNYSGANANDLTAWYITRFEDTNGNYMTYYYTNPIANSLYISEIKFSANVAGLAPLNVIKFNYKQASRPEYAYVKGVSLQKTQILDYIEVKTNNQLFRKYQLTHTTDNLGYQRVTQLQEFNGSLEPANPIVFEYNATPDGVNMQMYPPQFPSHPQSYSDIPSKTYTNNIYLNGIQLSGDFDGDGRLDFIGNDNALYTNLFEGSSGNTPIGLPFSAVTGRTFAVNTIFNNKLSQNNIIVDITDNTEGYGINFNYYKLNSGTLTNFFTKNIPIGPTTYSTETVYRDQILNSWEDAYAACNTPNDCGPATSEGDNSPATFLEGDFNGDGVSEFIFEKITSYTTIQEAGLILFDGSNGDPRTMSCPYCTQTVSSTSTTNAYILDTNPNTVGFGVLNDPNYLLSLVGIFGNTNRVFVYDFNGDGKSDILNIQYGNYKILTIEDNTVVLLGQGTLPEFSNDKPILFGDYNGDGKTDIMIPVAVDSATWRIYYANPKPTGGIFFDSVYTSSVQYHPTQSGSTYRDWTDYYAIDVNKDGKTDLVSVYRNYYKPGWTINDHDTSWRVQAFTNNLATSGTFSPYYDSDVRNSFSPEIPTVVTSNYKNDGLNNDLVIVRGNSNVIEYYGFAKNVQTDNLLKKVTSSGGNIVDEISYQTMEPSTTLNNGQGALNEFYSSNDSVNYPNVEIKKLPTMNLVSQLKNTVEGITRFQDFRYNGFAVNLHGLGSLGFNKTARSVWYQDSTAPRIWSVTETDPLLRGASTRSYTQLLSGENFSFMSLGTIPNGIINSTLNDFSSNTTNDVYKIQLDKQVVKDYLTNTSNETTYAYDLTYLLPTTTISKNLSNNVLEGTVTTTNTYDNNPTGIGNNYYIGRPKNSKTVTSAYANNSENSMEYYYVNNRLTKTKKKGNTTAVKYLVEDFEYDSYGNITKKTLSTEGYTGVQLNPRSTVYTYDLSGRFIKTTKDVEGLIATNNTFHALYGLVTSSTNPFGLTTTSLIDNWGKPTKVTDYLGKSINFSYTKSGTIYTESKTGDDGSMSIAISDALGRPIKAGSKNIDGNWSYKDQNYDFLGRKYRTSEPYATGSPTLWNTTTYDNYNRPTTITSATGLTTNITYSDLTITANDSFKTTTTTKNSNGHVVSSSDNGGIINYTYYASGNLKTSNFEGTIISTEYDEWGNKTKLTDPSAGVYTYSYYPTGETRIENTPKGKTTYTLDPATGKIISKNILGDSTDSTTTYTYDPVTKLPIQTQFFDAIEIAGTTYNYTYDNTQHIIATEERNELTTFVHNNTYDDFGRLDTETYIATNNVNGLDSKKTIKNTYKNGSHWQILDNDTSERLWETYSVNARGQLTLGGYGNDIMLSNSYDQYGFATKSSNQKANTTTMALEDVMTLFYSFDPVRGNLKSRTNTIFAWSEGFAYDDLDRLIGYTNAQGVQEVQTYDNKGRIATNPAGAYNYTNTAKKYQNTSVTLTPDATTYYQAEGQQNITYNVFKSPVRIQSNLDMIDFTYNMLNNRSAMYYGSPDKDRTLRPMHKFYDASGTMEIKYNINEDITEFITYIGGDAYTAPVVIKSNGKDQEFLYLHRDYQGSILAITNQEGQVVEKRLFDAWGNITKVQNGAGTNLGKLTVLDRGYTGHEHLQSVGLIHMNGRLYDPKLHRFLQPDNNIQDPYNTQNYNRYGYVLNNPLKYTDPSGEEYGLGTAVIIGVAIAAITYTLTALTTDTPFSVGGLVKASFIGAVSAAVTFGIGTAVSTLGNVYVETAMGAFLHGTFQGAMSGIQGGNFWQSFAAGAIASIAASAFTFDGNVADNNSLGWGDSVRNSTGGMIAFGTIAGGAGASLSGGNFWQGAVTGLVVSGLNHAMHQMSEKTTLTEDDIKKIYDAYPSGDSSDPNFVHRDDVYKNIGGDIYKDYLLHGYDSNGNPNPAYANTCALRLSTALNKAGYTISKTSGTFSGAKKLNYFYKVDKIQVYLSNTYNFSQASLGMQIQSSIIIQKNCGWSDATGHVDVLYGGKAGSHFYNECTTTFYSSK